MLPAEVIEYILRLGGLPPLHELVNYGGNSIGPRLLGTYDHAHLLYARLAGERTVWRAMRRVKGRQRRPRGRRSLPFSALPCTQKDLRTYYKPLPARLLEMIETRLARACPLPLTHEAQNSWMIGDRLWTFYDKDKRPCLYASLHKGRKETGLKPTDYGSGLSYRSLQQ